MIYYLLVVIFMVMMNGLYERLFKQMSFVQTFSLEAIMYHYYSFYRKTGEKFESFTANFLNIFP